MMKGRIFFRKEKNLQFLFQNVSKKEEKQNKMEEEHENTKVYVDL